MPQTIPIQDLRDALEISELCHRVDEPIYITKNGYSDMVLMSTELYNAMQRKWDLYKEINRSERQIGEGKTTNAFAALSDIRQKYDL